MSAGDYQKDPSTDSELLEVVDEDDRVLRLESRRMIHLQGLLHRAVHVILSRADGSIVLQRRASTKDHYPGWWDLSVGGHVAPGEAYEQAAVREMAEEMGVRGAMPRLAAVLRPSRDNGWEHIHVFGCCIACAVRPDPREIMDHRWVAPEEFLQRASPEAADEAWRVTPTSVASIRAWWEAGAPG